MLTRGMSIVLMVHNNWMACFDKKKTARDIRFNFTTMCEFFKKRHYVQKTEQTDYGKGRNHHSYYIFIIYLKSTHTLSAKSLATRTRYLRSKLCRRCRWLLGYTFFHEYLRELEKNSPGRFYLFIWDRVEVFLTLEKGRKSRDTFPLSVFLLTKVFLFYFHTLSNWLKKENLPREISKSTCANSKEE